MANLKLSLVLEAIDRISKPVAKTVDSVRGLGRSSTAASVSVGRLATKIDQAARVAPVARVALANSASEIRAVGRSADRSSGQVSRLARRIAVLSRRPSLLVVRTRVNEAGLRQFEKGAGRWGERIGRVIGLGLAGAFSATIALPLILGRAAFDAGRRLDKGFASKTTAIFGQLSKAFDSFLLKIGRAGVFDFVIAQLSKFNAWVQRLSADGTLDKWANTIATAVLRIGKAIVAVDWIALATNIFAVGKFVFYVARAVAKLGGGGLGGLFNVAIVAIIAKIGFGLYSLGTALGIVSIAGAPLWAVVAVIGALAAGAFLVWRNWKSISALLSNAWAALLGAAQAAANGIVSFFSGIWGTIKTAFSTGAQIVWNALPNWFRGILSGAAFVLRTVIGSATPPGPSGVAQPRSGRPVVPPLGRSPSAPNRNSNSPPGTAKISLHVSADPGVRVRTRELQTTGLAVNVNRGRAMASFA